MPVSRTNRQPKSLTNKNWLMAVTWTNGTLYRWYDPKFKPDLNKRRELVNFVAECSWRNPQEVLQKDAMFSFFLSLPVFSEPWFAARHKLRDTNAKKTHVRY